jgi:hypothetical protein
LEVLHDVRITFVICKFGESRLHAFIGHIDTLNFVKGLVQVVTLNGKFGIEIWFREVVQGLARSLGVLLGWQAEKSIVYGEFRLFLGEPVMDLSDVVELI